MLTIGAIGFLEPWVLAGTLALPVIWWLLRFTPPRPRRQPFPPFRLLLRLKRTEETPDRSPWWLTALRILATALVILAFARPVLNPSDFATSGTGPLVIVVDDGWAAASRWEARKELVVSLIEGAERRGRGVLLATSSSSEAKIEAAEIVLRSARAKTPLAIAPNRQDLLDSLRETLGDQSDIEIVWIADGLDYGGAAAFAEGLRELAPEAHFTLFRDDAALTPLWLRPARLEDDKLVVEAHRAVTETDRNDQITAHALNGRLIDRQPLVLGAGKASATAEFALPANLRNQVARFEIVGERSAGAVTLIDERWQKRIVAMLAGGSAENAQPLLAPLYFVERALEPFAELRRPRFGEAVPAAKDMIGDGLSMMVLADMGTLIESDREALEDWIESGGTLVRFAGPRLAAGSDDLLPVRIRKGGRSLGGALSWEAPQSLAAFDEGSPFAGLEVPEEVTIERQILAEPDVTLSEKTWARLTDGTPLVTASRLGKGRIVLFHVTANADWSKLPLSGLFVDMMRRLLDLSQGVAGAEVASTSDVAAAFLNPSLVMDGGGQLGAPPPTTEPIARAELDDIRPGPLHPPGFYGPASARLALNMIAADDVFTPIPDIAGAEIRTLGAGGEVELLGWMVIAAITLLVIDAIAVLTLAGQLTTATVRPVAVAVLLNLVAVGFTFNPALAQDGNLTSADEFAMRASLTTRLAYVITGDDEVDEISRAGLTRLSVAIANRTALEPSAPVGLNIEQDQLVFFPIIYWPVLIDAQSPSEAALVRIDSYMKHGGTLFFDTRDAPVALPATSIRRDTAQLSALQRIIAKLDVPPLEPVPPNHVLTKSFYLLQSFPGRFEQGALWVEASARSGDVIDPTDRTNADGVSSILIGSNDYAGAWATDETGRPLLPTGSGGEQQREIAFRVGINLVMYALTGNYKADQVHIPALLERLGQ